MKPNNDSHKQFYLRLLLGGIFIVVFAIFILAVDNHLGSLVPEGSTVAGQYVPHEYFTGYTTETPFKIASGVVALALLTLWVRIKHSTGKTLLLLLIYVPAVLVLGYIVVFSLYFGT